MERHRLVPFPLHHRFHPRRHPPVVARGHLGRTHPLHRRRRAKLMGTSQRRSRFRDPQPSAQSAFETRSQPTRNRSNLHHGGALRQRSGTGDIQVDEHPHRHRSAHPPRQAPIRPVHLGWIARGPVSEHHVDRGVVAADIGLSLLLDAEPLKQARGKHPGVHHSLVHRPARQQLGWHSST